MKIPRLHGRETDKLHAAWTVTLPRQPLGAPQTAKPQRESPQKTSPGVGPDPSPVLPGSTFPEPLSSSVLSPKLGQHACVLQGIGAPGPGGRAAGWDVVQVRG